MATSSLLSSSPDFSAHDTGHTLTRTKGKRKKPYGKTDYHLLPCPSVRLSSLKNLSAIKPRSLGPFAKPPGEARTLSAAAGEIRPALVSPSFCR